MIGVAHEIAAGIEPVPPRVPDGPERALAAAGMVAWRWDLATGKVVAAADGDPAAPDLLASVHPDDQDGLRKARDAATVEPGSFGCTYRVLDGAGGVRWLESRGAVATQADGARHLVGIAWDITARRRAEAERAASEGSPAQDQALRESEERLRLAVEATALGTWDVHPEAGSRRWSDELRAILGLPADANPDFDLFASVIHPADREWVSERYRGVYDVRGGGRYDAEFRILRANDGAERWVHTTGRVFFDEAGHPLRAIGTIRDVTDRRQAQEALKESEERYRALVETAPDAVYVHRDGTIILANRQAEALFGAAEPEALIGRSVFDLVDGASLELARSRTQTLTAPGARAERAELIYRRLDGTPFPVEAAAAAVLIDGRLAVQVVVRDVSARKAAEERQRLLLQELSHRVKNTLAVVQGIANQTMTGERSLEEEREILSRRLQALANAHNLLTRSEWRSADLRTLATAELRPYDGRVRVRGEALALSPRATLSLSLVLHELATNAAKHGALSGAQGEVELAWEIEREPEARLVLRWREQGGPAVEAPIRRGFGRLLIEGSVAHELRGKAKLGFEPDGLCCEIAVPLASVAAGPASAELMPTGGAAAAPPGGPNS